jgi:plasmid stabilization system protein ParE
MSYELQITASAESDIQESAEWYEKQTDGLGFEFLRAVDARVHSIQRNPLLFTPIYKSIRRATLKRFPFGIFYLVQDEAIIIVACIHLSRNPKEWKGRV